MENAAVLLSLILSTATGQPIGVEALADELCRRDVVFLGEEHDNDEGHRMQAEIVEALRRRRPDVVISLEMFERDVQGALDDYLRGRIGEDEFLKLSRPWPNYKKHYRPVVEIAREHGLDVIAANVPRAAARRASVKGAAAAAAGSDTAGLPRTTSSPRDRYFDLFKETMKDHVGSDNEDALVRMYEAQCLKDDGMAEAVADYLAQHAHRRPLVIHLCGRFHSDFGLGTAFRLLQRRPLTQLGVLTMVAAEDPEKVKIEDHRDRAHFVLAVKEEPKPEKADEKKKPEGEPVAAAPEAAEAVVATSEAQEVPPAPPAPDAPPAPAVKTEEAPAPQGRPALGIMPDYGATDPGVTISGATSGGAAETAGLKGGDRIIKLDKERIADLQEYMEVLEDLKPGQVIDVTFVRDGAEQTVKVKLGVSHRN